MASVATLSVHGLIALLLLVEDRVLLHPLPPARKLAGTWITLFPQPRLPAPEESPRSSTLPWSSERSLAAPPQSITSPVPPPMPEGNVQDEAAASDPGITAGIDWHAAADRLAARRNAIEEAGSGFSGNVQAMRKPCTPRDSSFEWSPEEDRAGFFPLPYMMIGERCVIGLGFFSCALNAGAPPSKHLFDDMQSGRTPDSSVPDPDFCD